MIKKKIMCLVLSLAFVVMSSQAEAGRFPLSYGKGNVKYGELINKRSEWNILFFYLSTED